MTQHCQKAMLIFLHRQVPVWLDHHKNINTRRKFMLLEPPRLAHAAADGISFHGGTAFFGDGYGHTGRPGISSPQHAGHQRLVPPAVAGFIYGVNKFFSGKSMRFQEPQRFCTFSGRDRHARGDGMIIGTVHDVTLTPRCGDATDHSTADCVFPEKSPNTRAFRGKLWYLGWSLVLRKKGRRIMSLLSVKNVSKAYGLRHVLENITMDVQAGDRIGLIGPNGAGKSTLVKIIAGVEEPDHGTATLASDATMSYAAQQPRLDVTQTVRQQVELVFAHVREIEQQLQLAAEELARDPDGPEHDAALKHYDHLQHQFQHLEGWDIQRRVQMVLEQLGFTDGEMDKPVANLSGGQKSRIQLARMLLEGADLLLLDEPTNHLDIPMLTWLENTLSGLDDTAMIIVSHDRYFLDRVVNKVIDLRSAGIEEYVGNYSAYMTQRAERLLTQQRVYEQQKAFIAKQEEYIRRFSAGQRAMQARGRKTRLERFKNESAIGKPGGDAARMILNLELEKPSGQHVLKLRDLSKAFGEKILFDNITLELTRGDRLGIVGPNGSGKSTLLNILAGKQPPDTGEMIWGHGTTVQYFQQEHQDLNPDNTVMEEIHSVKPVTPPQDIRELAALFLFSGDDIFKKVGTLSGGEKARVAMAKMLLKPANVILMDEPTNHLDMNTCEVVEAALESYDGTLIVVSHDRYFLANVCDRILAMEPDQTAPGGWRLVDGTFDDYVADREKRTRNKAAAAKAAATASAKQTKATPAAKAQVAKQAVAEKPKLPWHLEKLSAEELEKMIQTKEQELGKLESQFADPAIAAVPAKLKKHQQEYEKLQSQIAEAMNAWEVKAAK